MDEDELLRKYRQRIAAEFGEQPFDQPKVTLNYAQFKKENLPVHLSLYEKLCNFSGRFLNIKPDQKTEAEVQELLGMCHISTTPAGTTSFAILASLLVAVFGSLFGYFIFRQFFFVFYFTLIGLVLLVFLMKLPEFLANNWRLKASNQMVQCIFYVVTYMRHTSNLELAVKFASDHLSPPLSLDLKKVLWDVETQRYSSVKESLDVYLEAWKKWNPEFVESFHLVESSLYEPSDQKRQEILDKSLDVMLQETYEKMLHYAHSLKGPITMLYMLGIILPILGLVILPLVASFMTQSVSPGRLALYIAVLYNITLPLGIFYLGKAALSKRPTGYGETDISESPELKKYSQAGFFSPIVISAVVLVLLMTIGLTPLLVRAIIPEPELVSEQPVINNFRMWEYRQITMGKGPDAVKEIAGPYGLGAAILSIFVILAIALAIGLYNKLKSKNVMKIREDTKRLEEEFSSALFQLGNRLGDGIPAEIAVGKVADSMRGTVAGDFFQLVSDNIQKKGMSLEASIFNPRTGALAYYPSPVIESTMKVLVESSKKGPLIASKALISVSEYIKEIHRVNERLRDLMAEIISDMKQQVTFLAPAIAAIVVGITSMIVMILGRLSQQFADLSRSSASAVGQQVSLPDIFGAGIPAYYFQIIVGLYVVQVVFILTIMINGIENGSDRLAERHMLGSNMISAALLYAFLSLAVILMFNFIAASIMGGLA